MRAIIALVALLLLSGQGIDPLAPSNEDKSSATAAPAPAAEPVVGTPDPAGTVPANPPAAGSAPIGTVSPAEPGAAAPAKAKDAKAKDQKLKADTAAAGKPEVLPWADKPLTPAPPVDPSKAAAASPCDSQQEAGCREQKKKCAWVAEMKHTDGSVVPGRCAPRATAPVKKAQAPAAAKPKPKPKPPAEPAAAVAPPSAEAAPAEPSAKPAPASPVTITVNPPSGATPPAAPADSAAEEGIPAPAAP